VAALGAALKALTAADAAVKKELELGLAVQRFGVVTPETAEVAALEKDGGPDAGSVVYRETLDICDDSCTHSIASL
jgi:hypothetical protein